MNLDGKFIKSSNDGCVVLTDNMIEAVGILNKSGCYIVKVKGFGEQRANLFESFNRLNSKEFAWILEQETLEDFMSKIQYMCENVYTPLEYVLLHARYENDIDIAIQYAEDAIELIEKLISELQNYKK